MKPFSDIKITIRIFCSYLIALVFISYTPSRSQAGFVLTFDSSGSRQTVAFTAIEGQSIQIPIYLVQTDGEERLNTIGMFSAGVTLSYGHLSSGTVPFDTPSSATLANHWTSTSNEVVVNHSERFVTLEGLVDDPRSPVFASSNSILIGSVTFTAGPAGNETRLGLSLVQNSSFANNFADVNEPFPDHALGFDQASFVSITAVPEPSSLILVGLVVSGALCRRVSLREKSKT